MRAGLFPGQAVPVATVLEALTPASETLAEANDVLGYDLRRRVQKVVRSSARTFDTSLAQPAILVAGVAAWRSALASGATFELVLGHSLGEYTALVAAEAMSFRDALGVVAVRARVMREAARARPGGMLALLGMDHVAVAELAAASGATVANDNCPGQMVLSGTEEQLALASSQARARGGRAVLLDVSGPFHTEAMAPARAALKDALFHVTVRSPRVPVISNVTTRPYRSPGEIRHLLVEQMCSPIRFRGCVEWAWGQGVREFVDLGPGRIVEGLAARTVRVLRQPEAAGV